MKHTAIALGLCLLMLGCASCGSGTEKNAETGADTITASDAAASALPETETEERTSGTQENADAEDDKAAENDNALEFHVEMPEIEKVTLPPLADKNVEPFSMISWNLDPESAQIYSSLSDAKKLEIETRRSDVQTKLMNAFQKQGINVEINAETGEAMMDSSVLFGGDSAVLTDQGKSYLKKFITAYASVVTDPSFDGFISRVMVEGHAAPVAGDSYEVALPLSEERAKNVMNYCLSSETGISGNAINAMKKLMEAKGYSNSRPVKDSDGKVDMAASRRVSFRFIIDVNA